MARVTLTPARLTAGTAFATVDKGSSNSSLSVAEKSPLGQGRSLGKLRSNTAIPACTSFATGYDVIHCPYREYSRSKPYVMTAKGTPCRPRSLGRARKPELVSPNAFRTVSLRNLNLNFRTPDRKYPSLLIVPDLRSIDTSIGGSLNVCASQTARSPARSTLHTCPHAPRIPCRQPYVFKILFLLQSTTTKPVNRDPPAGPAESERHPSTSAINRCALPNHSLITKNGFPTETACTLPTLSRTKTCSPFPPSSRL